MTHLVREGQNAGSAPALNRADRCDRCGAAAQIRFTPSGGEGELLFCGHHGRLHQPVLIQQGVIEGDLW